MGVINLLMRELILMNKQKISEKEIIPTLFCTSKLVEYNTINNIGDKCQVWLLDAKARRTGAWVKDFRVTNTCENNNARITDSH